MAPKFKLDDYKVALNYFKEKGWLLVFDFKDGISVNKARLVLTRTLQLALSWNSPTFSYFFIFLTFFFTNEEKTKNPPGALETRDVALQDDHKKERKRRVQHRYTMTNENMILNFKTGRENSICMNQIHEPNSYHSPGRLHRLRPSLVDQHTLFQR